MAIIILFSQSTFLIGLDLRELFLEEAPPKRFSPVIPENADAEAGPEDGEQVDVEVEEEPQSLLDRLSDVEVSRVSIGHTHEAQITARDTLTLEGQLGVVSSAQSKGRVRSFYSTC